jgi:hypothetical protein
MCQYTCKGGNIKCNEINNEVFSGDKPSEDGVSWGNRWSTLGQDIAVPSLYGHKYNLAVLFITSTP